MANEISFFGDTPDYGLSQDIMRILGLSTAEGSEGHVGGGTYTKGEYSSGFAGSPGVETAQHDYGMFDPFNEGMIATALAKKYNLSGEEQRKLFKPGLFSPLQRSMTKLLNPSMHRKELPIGGSLDPLIPSTQPSMSSGMAGSGKSILDSLTATRALRKERSEGISGMTGNIMGIKDDILAQITGWDDMARKIATDAGAGNLAPEDDKKFWEFWK